MEQTKQILELYQVEDSFVKPCEKFEYEVYIYVHNNDCVRLENTITYTCDKPIIKLVNQSFRKFKGGYIHKFIEMTGAPLNWLKENSTNIIFEETTKEKKLRLKNK